MRGMGRKQTALRNYDAAGPGLLRLALAKTSLDFAAALPATTSRLFRVAPSPCEAAKAPSSSPCVAAGDDDGMRGKRKEGRRSLECKVLSPRHAGKSGRGIVARNNAPLARRRRPRTLERVAGIVQRLAQLQCPDPRLRAGQTRERVPEGERSGSAEASDVPASAFHSGSVPAFAGHAKRTRCALRFRRPPPPNPFPPLARTSSFASCCACPAPSLARSLCGLSCTDTAAQRPSTTPAPASVPSRLGISTPCAPSARTSCARSPRRPPPVRFDECREATSNTAATRNAGERFSPRLRSPPFFSHRSSAPVRRSRTSSRALRASTPSLVFARARAVTGRLSLPPTLAGTSFGETGVREF